MPFTSIFFCRFTTPPPVLVGPTYFAFGGRRFQPFVSKIYTVVLDANMDRNSLVLDSRDQILIFSYKVDQAYYVPYSVVPDLRAVKHNFIAFRT